MPTSASSQRWGELLDGVVALLPAGTGSVLVDGTADAAADFTARLAAATPITVAPVKAAPGEAAPGDVVIRLRTGRSDHPHSGRPDIVIDLHDPDWPVMRRVAARLTDGPAGGAWYRTETRAFFAYRAASWDTKFGDDLPAYTAAIGEAALPRGGVVLDIGCGSGRALPPLRQAVGPGGAVIALDLTPEMLAAARPRSVSARAALVHADARTLPLADASADAIFAAGLVHHLPDPEAGLRELARVTRPGGRLVLFHPTGRAALAARHGRGLAPDEPLAEGTLRRSTAASGWRLTAYDDAAHRFFALAERG